MTTKTKHIKEQVEVLSYFNKLIKLGCPIHDIISTHIKSPSHLPNSYREKLATVAFEDDMEKYFKNAGFEESVTTFISVGLENGNVSDALALAEAHLRGLCLKRDRRWRNKNERY